MAADTVMVRLDMLPQSVVDAILAAAESPDLPAVTTTQNGKILKVVSGEWKAASEKTELPSVSGSDNGAVLLVSSGKWAKGTLAKELPAVTGEDDGKVLKVVNGAWAAVLEEGSE